MKKYALSLLAVLGIAGFVSAAFAEESAPVPGRFQLMQGRYPQWNADTNETTQKEDLFMIDTATGETWFYASASKGKKESRYWLVAAYEEKTPGSSTMKPSLPPGAVRDEGWQKV